MSLVTPFCFNWRYQDIKKGDINKDTSNLKKLSKGRFISCVINKS